MSLRGKAAIVGIGELPSVRSAPGRSYMGLAAEVARQAIEDAGLKKRDIDGIITEGDGQHPADLGEYIDIQPTFGTGVSMWGASGTSAVAIAATAIEAGYANYILVAMAATRDPAIPWEGMMPREPNTEFDDLFGPAPVANNGYGLMYQRHIYEFGTKPEQFAKQAAAQRFNALTNPNAVFRGQPITAEDVLNSRYVNAPLRLLDCVMPCAGAEAVIVTSAERARALPSRAAYILGAGMGIRAHRVWLNERLTHTATEVAAPRAFKMAGYSPKDMQFNEFYD